MFSSVYYLFCDDGEEDAGEDEEECHFGQVDHVGGVKIFLRFFLRGYQ